MARRARSRGKSKPYTRPAPAEVRRVAGTARDDAAGYMDLADDHSDVTASMGMDIPWSPERASLRNSDLYTFKDRLEEMASDFHGQDFGAERLIKELECYSEFLHSFLDRRQHGASTMQLEVDEGVQQELEEVRKRLEEVWTDKVMNHLLKQATRLIEKSESASCSIALEDHFSKLGWQISHACGTIYMHDADMDHEEWQRFMPRCIDHSVHTIIARLFEAHNHFQTALYLGNDDERVQLWYLIWKSLQKTFRLLQRHEDTFPSAEYCIESSFFRTKDIRELFEFTAHQADFFIPEEIENIVGYYCQLIDEHHSQIKPRSGHLRGLSAKKPLSAKAMLELEGFSSKHQWDQAALKALHWATIRLNHLTQGPVVFRRHGVETDYWPSGHLQDDATSGRQDITEPTPILPASEEDDSSQIDQQSAGTIMDIDDILNDASTLQTPTRSNSSGRHSHHDLTAVDDRIDSFSATGLPTPKSLPSPSHAKKGDSYANDATVMDDVSSQDSVSMEISPVSDTTGTIKDNAAPGHQAAVQLSSEADDISAVSEDHDELRPKWPEPRGQNLVSAYDYVYCPIPENRKYENANSRLINRDMKDTGIMSEGLRVEDLVNVPPAHCRTPGTFSLWKKRDPRGPYEVFKLLGSEVVRRLLGRRSDPPQRPKFPPMPKPRSRCQHYKHVLAAKRDARRRVAKATARRIPTLRGGGVGNIIPNFLRKRPADDIRVPRRRSDGSPTPMGPRPQHQNHAGRHSAPRPPHNPNQHEIKFWVPRDPTDANQEVDEDEDEDNEDFQIYEDSNNDTPARSSRSPGQASNKENAGAQDHSGRPSRNPTPSPPSLTLSSNDRTEELETRRFTCHPCPVYTGLYHHYCGEQHGGTCPGAVTEHQPTPSPNKSEQCSPATARTDSSQEPFRPGIRVWRLRSRNPEEVGTLERPPLVADLLNAAGGTLFVVEDGSLYLVRRLPNTEHVLTELRSPYRRRSNETRVYDQGLWRPSLLRDRPVNNSTALRITERGLLRLNNRNWARLPQTLGAYIRFTEDNAIGRMTVWRNERAVEILRPLGGSGVDSSSSDSPPPGASRNPISVCDSPAHEDHTPVAQEPRPDRSQPRRSRDHTPTANAGSQDRRDFEAPSPQNTAPDTLAALPGGAHLSALQGRIAATRQAYAEENQRDAHRGQADPGHNHVNAGRAASQQQQQHRSPQQIQTRNVAFTHLQDRIDYLRTFNDDSTEAVDNASEQLANLEGLFLATANAAERITILDHIRSVLEDVENEIRGQYEFLDIAGFTETAQELLAANEHAFDLLTGALDIDYDDHDLSPLPPRARNAIQASNLIEARLRFAIEAADYNILLPTLIDADATIELLHLAAGHYQIVNASTEVGSDDEQFTHYAVANHRLIVYTNMDIAALPGVLRNRRDAITQFAAQLNQLHPATRHDQVAVQGAVERGTHAGAVLLDLSREETRRQELINMLVYADHVLDDLINVLNGFAMPDQDQ